MVTYILLVYNHFDYIRKSLESLEGQTQTIDELIIADDCSTDGTSELIPEILLSLSFPVVKYLRNDINKGLIRNFNSAIEESSGDVILIGAGDDFCHQDRVKKTHEYFNSNSDCDLVLTSYALVDEFNNVGKIVHREGFFSDPLPLIKKGGAYPPYGMAFTVNIKNRFFPIPDVLKNEDDYLCMAGLASSGVTVLREVLYYYRIHSGSLSGWSLLEKDNVKYVNKFILDQRNRTNNFLVWKSLLESCSRLDCAREIEQRIDISTKFEKLETVSFIERSKYLFSRYSILGSVDVILLVFGVRGILLIRFIKRLKKFLF